MPQDKLVLRFDTTLAPGARYYVEVRGARNLNGAAADGHAVLRRCRNPPPAPARADSTARRARFHQAVTDSPDPRRRLPSVDALLADPAIAALAREQPRALLLRAVRGAVEGARASGGAAPAAGWPAAVRAQLERLGAPSLVPVINATGVVLHTNLGRALLAPAAVQAMTAVARSYASVEYDLGRGARGSRHAICRDLLVELTGAEDAMVVNNAAAGLLLALSALARDGEAIVSRGELVEIGGAFRVPDILARSGARLVEVGTTNRTHLDDYVKAITPRTRALLKVHRSNFRVTGFTAEVAAAELAQLARASGAASLLRPGERAAARSLSLGTHRRADAARRGGERRGRRGRERRQAARRAAGRDRRSGRRRRSPPARPIRWPGRCASDKFTLAALEATLALYRDPETARREIPTLRMLTTTRGRRRGEAIRASRERR